MKHNSPTKKTASGSPHTPLDYFEALAVLKKYERTSDFFRGLLEHVRSGDQPTARERASVFGNVKISADHSWISIQDHNVFQNRAGFCLSPDLTFEYDDQEAGFGILYIKDQRTGEQFSVWKLP